MSNDINFAPSTQPRSKKETGEIEYSTVAEDPSTVRIAAPVETATTPKKTRSFFSWRKNRSTVSEPSALPQAPVTFGTHDAPQHQKEEALPNLLHAVDATPAPIRQQPVTVQPKQVVKPVAIVTPSQPRVAQPQKVAPITQAASTPVLAPEPVIAQPVSKPVRPLTRKEKKQRLVDELPMAEVNLIPDTTVSGKDKRNKLRDLGYIVVVLVVLVLLAYGGFKLYERKITADTVAVEIDIQTVSAQIAKYQGIQTEAKEISDRLAALEQILKTHVYWTPFLSVVESLTLPTVYYTSMTGSSTSLTFTFDAIAQDYSQIAPQVASFRESPFVTSINISAVQAFQSSTVISETSAVTDAQDRTGVSFKMTVQFSPDVFIHQQLRSYAKN